jgi:hypothetical protein
MTAARAMKWFRISVGFGLVINLVFTLPAIFAPRSLEDLASFGKTNTVHWVQNVGVLLAIVTAMYIPVIVDPLRYLFITYLVVAGRFAAGMLFLTGVVFGNYPSGMTTLAGSDLVLSSLQTGLLFFALRGRSLSLWGETTRPVTVARGVGHP